MRPNRVYTAIDDQKYSKEIKIAYIRTRRNKIAYNLAKGEYPGYNAQIMGFSCFQLMEFSGGK